MSDIVPYEEKGIVEAFTGDDGLKDVVSGVRAAVENFEHDLSTAAGRKRTASLSAKVSKFKVKVDALGKDLVSEWKTKAKAVDDNRKKMREALDEIRDEARKPLNDWEAEQKRLKEEEGARLEAEKLVKQIENDHEIAVLMDREFDRVREEEVKEAERVRLEQEAIKKKQQEEHEKRITEEARLEAERKQKLAEEREKQALEQQKIAEARIKAAEEVAIAERKAAKEREIAQMKAAEEMAIAQKKAAEEAALVAAENARKAEIARQEQAEREELEKQQSLERNRRHVGNKRREAKECLMEIDGVSEDIAKKVVTAISQGKIKNISINY